MRQKEAVDEAREVVAPVRYAKFESSSGTLFNTEEMAQRCRRSRMPVGYIRTARTHSMIKVARSVIRRPRNAKQRRGRVVVHAWRLASALAPQTATVPAATGSGVA